MNRSGFYRLLATGLLVLAFSLPTASTAFARQEETVDTSGRFRVEVGGVFGKGFNREYVADSDTGEPIYIGAGGGAGLAVTMGYGLTKRFDIDVSAVRQRSVNKTNLINGEMEFKKTFLLGSLKYKITVPPTLDLYGGQIKIGAGLGLYQATELTITHNDMATGMNSHIIIDYKPTLGYHGSLEFETFMPNDWSLSLGTRVYKVDFEADSTSTSGIFVLDPTIVPVSRFQEMRGSGVDFLITLGKYFW